MSGGGVANSGRQVQLFAVQARPKVADYADEAAFAAMIAGTVSQVHAARDAALPAIVAFPEIVGMPLAWGLDFADVTASAGTPIETMQCIGESQADRLTALAEETGIRGPQLIYLLQWRRVYDAYVTTFSHIARELHAYVAAGSVFLPPVDEESSKGGPHLEDACPQNLAYLFNPRGRVVGRTAKVHFVEDEDQLGLRAGRLEDLRPVHTRIGRLGTAICLDAFHETVLRQFDQAGTDIVIQPSANAAGWHEPWVFDPTITQEAAWMRDGMAQGLRDRESLRFGVNPMLVTDAWGLGMEGRSAIMANASVLDDVDWDGPEGFLARAPDAHAECAVAATVTLAATTG